MWTWIWLGCGGAPAPCEAGVTIEAPRAAGCRVLVDGRLLLVDASRGRGWSIPGGYVESGESSADAAARETMEEAHVRVVAGGPVCAARATRFVAHDCTAVGAPDPRPDGSETVDARFFDRAGLAALPPEAFRFPEQRDTYLEWLGASSNSAPAAADEPANVAPSVPAGPAPD